MENTATWEKLDHIKIPAFAEDVFDILTAEECKQLLMALFRYMETGEWPDTDAQPKIYLAMRFIIYADLMEE